MTDTEAGTPLTAALDALNEWAPSVHDSEAYLRWLQARAAIRDAARSATDPAGLDADDLLAVRGALAALHIEVEDHDWLDADREFVEHLTRTVERGQRAAARLSVADGPGPEERLRAALIAVGWFPDLDPDDYERLAEQLAAALLVHREERLRAARQSFIDGYAAAVVADPDSTPKQVSALADRYIDRIAARLAVADGPGPA